MTTYSFSQLEDLWVQAGGNPTAAPMAAAIAMAESGGNSTKAHSNTNGTIDRGLWQINSIHGSQSSLDVTTNTKAAVALSNNGQTWKPWCTAWSNGACGGQYLGSTAPFFKFLPSGAQTPFTTAAAVANLSNIDPLDPNSTGKAFGDSVRGLTGLVDPEKWVQAFYTPIATWLWYGGIVIAGFFMFFAGGLMILYETPMGQATKDVLLGAASFGSYTDPKKAGKKE